MFCFRKSNLMIGCGLHRYRNKALGDSSTDIYLTRIHALANFIFVFIYMMIESTWICKSEGRWNKIMLLCLAQVDERLRVPRDNEINSQGTKLNPAYILNEKYLAHLMWWKIDPKGKSTELNTKFSGEVWISKLSTGGMMKYIEASSQLNLVNLYELEPTS